LIAKRPEGHGPLCWIAARLSQGWDWIDDRDIDKHAVALVVMFGLIKITEWAMAFAGTHADKDGLQIAAIIASVTAPYMALLTAVISFYFKARTP